MGTPLMHTESPSLPAPSPAAASGCLHLIAVHGAHLPAASTPEPGSLRGSSDAGQLSTWACSIIQAHLVLIQRILWVCSNLPVQPGTVSGHTISPWPRRVAMWDSPLGWPTTSVWPSDHSSDQARD